MESPGRSTIKYPSQGTPRRPYSVLLFVGTNNSKRPIPNPKWQEAPLVHRGLGRRGPPPRLLPKPHCTGPSWTFLQGGCFEGLWEFAQPVHMCFVDLEKAFDRVPRGILWGVLQRVMGSGAFAKGCSVSVRPEQELGSHCRQGRRESRFGNHRISSLLFADDVVLMASSGQDLQHVLERFAAECEAAGMRISTSKSEAMVLDRKRVACPLQVGGEVLPQVEEFKYLGVLFTSEGKMEREIDRRIGAASAEQKS
ncbi:hypothetical protein L3Q82_018655 [Scortum barcoo]|uniref:Uncharacterized protein n=1 Tax=Scortum barcoo TaxID=214431 RepID=A0ACB8VFS1_9TELE|nr:hypothetical protein L3Q82_018655 [Scortum barcoo]